MAAEAATPASSRCLALLFQMWLQAQAASPKASFSAVRRWRAWCRQGPRTQHPVLPHHQLLHASCAFFSRWKRSATCTAPGAPLAVPEA